MNVATRKQVLLEYLLNNLKVKYEEEFEDRTEGNGAMGYESYEEFVQYQKGFVETLDEKTLTSLEFLTKLMPSAQALYVSKFWEDLFTTGFVLNKEGQVVFIVEP